MSSTRKSPPHAGLVAALTLLLVPSPTPAAEPQQERTASPCESGVQTESVKFLHEDEKREGEGFLTIADRRIFAIMAFANAMGTNHGALPRASALG